MFMCFLSVFSFIRKIFNFADFENLLFMDLKERIFDFDIRLQVGVGLVHVAVPNWHVIDCVELLSENP